MIICVEWHEGYHVIMLCFLFHDEWDGLVYMQCPQPFTLFISQLEALLYTITSLKKSESLSCPSPRQNMFWFPSRMSVCMFFRDIIQRVAEVTFVFCFTHLFDAIAVSNNVVFSIQVYLKCTQDLSPVQTYTGCDLTDSLFDILRVWLEVFLEELENR